MLKIITWIEWKIMSLDNTKYKGDDRLHEVYVRLGRVGLFSV